MIFLHQQHACPKKILPCHFALAFSVVLSISLTACEPKTPASSTTSPAKPPHSSIAHCSAGTVTAEVIALEQIITYNRFGAFNPAGMVYALRNDVVKDETDKSGKEVNLSSVDDKELTQLAGGVRLKQGKRPRPLVLRVHEGECLQVKFWNLLSPSPKQHDLFQRADFPKGGVQRQAMIVTEADNPNNPGQAKGTDISTPPRNAPDALNKFPFPPHNEPDFPTTRSASIHVNGLDFLTIESDGANVGNNPSSLVNPGESKIYTWYGRQEGGYFMYSDGALAGGEGDGGQLGLGLFGTVNVEPKGSLWYRSQVTYLDLCQAVNGKMSTDSTNNPVCKSDNTEITDYTQTDYAKLAIVDAKNAIQHGDLNAIIYQPDTVDAQGKLWESRDLDKNGKPIPGTGIDCAKLSPGASCGMSFREFTTIFHDENKVFQAFKELEDANNPISAVADGMAVNYGASGVGSAVLAKLKKIGPGKDCPECKLEEYFLSSWVNGDPAMIVQRDLNGVASQALYPDDPSNVHHSYLGDPVRFRNIHAGPKETHVFHLHAHQWLQDKNDPNANYLDSQTISPGSSYTYDIQYGGGGNRNLTVGDSIFHCHLYPHFAAGMWELWRNHDVFEDGKPGLFSNNHDPRARNLPDYEIAGGTPNPAVIAIPGYPLAPLPSHEMRGYPFFIAGTPGHRPPQPPLDMARDDKNPAVELNGGLPRHVIAAGGIKPPTDEHLKPEHLLKGRGDPEATKASRYVAKRTWTLNSDPNNLALAQELEWAKLKILPQCGSKDEILAMAYHAGWTKAELINLKNGINQSHDENGKPITLMPNWCVDEVKQSLASLENDFSWLQATAKVNWPNKAPNGKAVSPLWTGKGYQQKAATLPAANNHPYDPGKFFRVNGYQPKPGAPFAEPCPSQYYAGKTTDDSKPVPVNRDKPRLYKSAYIEFDMTVNKYGWHDPQARMPVLEADAADTLSGKRLAEPLFFRANSGDCIQFQATNLIPGVLNLDDFQVYTPTDTIGQHIHLVKFDVTSSDGSANGWNYEDGTFAPDEVRERIMASNFKKAEHPHRQNEPTVNDGSVVDTNNNPQQQLVAKTHPIFSPGASLNSKAIRGVCTGDKNEDEQHPWCGAQTTVQRWWADPVLNDRWDDRTMRTVFTHDHYGPSSHQQHGFYAALVVEDKDTVWTTLAGSPAKVDTQQNECNKTTLGGFNVKPCRPDGGPTSYAANIGVSKNHAHIEEAEHDHKIVREYNLAFADFAILYNADLRPVNPPSRQANLNLPDVVRDGLKPKPEGISTEDPGTRLLNYRNEPIPLRIGEEDEDSLEYQQKVDNKTGEPTAKGDMANVFSSLLHSSPTLPAAAQRLKKLQHLVPHEIIDPLKLSGLIDQQVDSTQKFNALLKQNEPWRLDGDPSTPVLGAYAGDRLNIQLIQGAQEEQHVFSMNGLKWLAEPKSPNSGYMNGQPIGISEHFEMEVKLPNTNMLTDYWFGSPSVENYWDGMWGLVRSFGGKRVFLPGENIQPEMAKLSERLNYEKPKPGTTKSELKTKDIIKNLAILPKNLTKKTDDLPDLHEITKTGLAIDFDSNVFNKNLLAKYSSNKTARNKVISYLNEKSQSKDLSLEKKHFDYFFDTQIWNKLVCPFNEYNKSNKKVKHVVAVLAEDIINNPDVGVNDRTFHAYSNKFNIYDPQSIVFMELDPDWVNQQQNQAEKIFIGIVNALNQKDLDDTAWKTIADGYAAQTYKGKDNMIPALAIINKLKSDYDNGKKIEPLVLRANAGDCIQVVLHNLLPEHFNDGPSNNPKAFNSWSYNLMPPIVSGFNFNQVKMSSTVNLIPQMVAYDVKEMGGGNIGANLEFNTLGYTEPLPSPKGIAGCRKITSEFKTDFSTCDNNSTDYIWYAGDRKEIDQKTFKQLSQAEQDATCPIKTKIGKGRDKGYLCHTPMEFGAVSLRSFGDVIKQSSHGAIGALVIEPKNSKPEFPDSSSRTTADIKDKTGKTLFREFVVLLQDDLSLQQNKQPMPNHRMADDAEDTGQKGLNYHTEPLWARNGVGTSGADFNTLNKLDYTNTLSSKANNPGCKNNTNNPGGTSKLNCGDPETPLFSATAGEPVRFRVVHPAGHSRQHAFVLHGHNWDYQPWIDNSTRLFDRTDSVADDVKPKTARIGAIGGMGPGRHFNILTDAGGKFAVPGDYLFRVQEQFQFQGGMWGIFRVNPKPVASN